jgi:hypothetical protein
MNMRAAYGQAYCQSILLRWLTLKSLNYVPQSGVAYRLAGGKYVGFSSFYRDEKLAGTMYSGPIASMASSEELFMTHENWEPSFQGLLKVSSAFQTALCTI